MSDGRTRASTQSQKIRARVGEDTANPVADCPSCDTTHEGTTRTRARSKAEACCNPDCIERIASYVNVPVHPQRLAHPDVPTRMDAIDDTNLDPDTAQVVGKDTITDGDGGWEVTYTIVGVDMEGGQ